MTKQLESSITSERLGLKIRWALLAGLALLMWRQGMLPPEGVILGFLVALNVLGTVICSRSHLYNRFGWLLTPARALEAMSLAGLAYFGPPGNSNIWLLCIAPILTEALVSRWSSSVLIVTAGAICSVVAALLVRKTSFVSFSITALSLGSFAFLALALSYYRRREEVLNARDRRLDTVLKCSAALASNSCLSDTILQVLKAVVVELEATGGYVMLTDPESGSGLFTEVAFSGDGEFRFPERLEIGDGVTGYAVKMKQPLVVHNNDDEQLDVEGIEASTRSVVSVPLVAKNITSAGQAANEQCMGAITLLGPSEKSFQDPLDMDLLSCLSSLVAVAVSNYRMEEKQRTTFLKTLESLAKSLEARDNYTRGHSQRVCEVSMMIGEHLGFSAEALEELRIGTILHDIGKIGVPDNILNKPSRLTDEEFAIMKTHPVIGYEICKPLMLSEGVLMIIRNHHEKLDGSGYPDGLKGGELPLSLRIVCVVDAFDAMSSSRPYRSVMDMDKVLAELSKGAGVQFDPVIVESLRQLLPTERMLECYRGQWEDTRSKAA